MLVEIKQGLRCRGNISSAGEPILFRRLHPSRLPPGQVALSAPGCPGGGEKGWRGC